MEKDVVNFHQKFSLFTEQWSPKIVAQMNNIQFKLVRVEGDFTWHDHKDTDEVFIVLEGQLRIDYRNSSVTLNEGEMHVVAKGVEHKPFAAKECKILLVEPAGTVNTGDAGGNKTAPSDVWI
ncbi:cupin domain-containing protein [Candidatus Gottesmanbacteria bacterium]|nr:cupin domain-containing protein [Candidatus Gottesmanbacteria bacterium]